MSPEPQYNYCPAHMEFITHIAEMRTSLSNIEKGISEDSGFKRGIISAFVGVFVTIVIQISIFSFLWGGIAKQVEINSSRWDRLLAIPNVRELVK